MTHFMRRAGLCVLAFSCSLQVLTQKAVAEDLVSLKTVRIIQPEKEPQPQKGSLTCYDVELEQKKTVCRYIPVHELATNVQAGILQQIYGGRQPSNPDEAYVRAKNGTLEFSHIDPKIIEAIIKILPEVDTLDTYIERRKVNVVVQILQLMEGSDDSAGFLLGAQYSGRDRQTVKEQDRFSATASGGLVNFNFAFGNLVNTLLDVVINNHKAQNNVKVISSVPLMLTHGYQLANISPYSKPIYIQTNSVTTMQEQEGVRFEGQARFLQNAPHKVLIKDFAVSVSQYEPGSKKLENAIEGVETFKSPVRDLELEIGCSTAIRVINVSRKAKSKQNNLFFSAKEEDTDSKKVFLFVVQAINDSNGTAPSRTCDETNATPELTTAK